MHRFVLGIILFLISLSGLGQNNRVLYHHIDKISIKQKVRIDSVKLQQASDEAITAFRMNGYTGVYLKDSTLKKNTIHYYYGYDNHFKKIQLIQTGTKKPQIYTTKNLNLTLDRMNKEIKDLENSGYPFSRLLITDQTEDKDLLQLTYQIDSGDFYIIDKIHIKSKNDFHEKTVLNTIGIKPGDIYNEEKIRNIESILGNTNRYNMVRSPEILFKVGKAELYVYVEKKKSSSADGYLGFQQDRITERLVLNGFVNLQLENALNRAEIIHLNWKNNPDKTQGLKMLLEYPYLFGSPVGVGADIDLRKQDTSFVRSDLLFELIYRNPQLRLSIFNQIESSSTTTSIDIPGFRDYAKNTIGASIEYRPFLPEKLNFYHPKLTLSGGVFNYRSDTISDNKRSISNNKFLIQYEHTFDFLRFFHLNNSLQFQGLASSIDLSRNEFIYFGGLQTVRGFYELELAGKSNWILRNEIEFKPLDLLSIKVLYDYSNFLNETHNYTHSAGVGFGLINNNSQLEIIVANGVLNDNPFLLSDTKVHIGFRSSF